VTVKNLTPSRPHLTLLVGLALSCSTGRQPVFLAPSGESIEAGSEMSYGGDGYNVYVMNHSSVPIEVTGLKLYDCENIRNPCDVAVALKVRLEPGRRQTVYTLKVANTERRSSFRFHFTWQQVAAR